MNDRSLAVRPPQRTRLREFLMRSPELGFQPRLLGKSDAPVFPQRAGDWWLEPLSPTTVLPRRAARRLAAVLAAGVQPKAIAVFHEIPIATVRAQPGAGAEMLESLARSAREAAPVLGDALAQASVSALGQAAHHTRRAYTWLRKLGSDVARDPCLVIVTQDGEWIELDRWYT